MSLFYITGPTAAGKTTVRDKLRDLGYEAHDTDENGICLHYSRKTGERIEYPNDPALRTPDWHADHEYKMSRDRIEELSLTAQSKPVFLCGAALNDLELKEYFEKIICLVIDLESVKQRLGSRKTNSFGKAPDELVGIIERHDAVIDKYRAAGAVMVSTNKPERDVISDILEITQVSS